MLSSGGLTWRLFGRLKRIFAITRRGVCQVLPEGLYIMRRALGLAE